MAEHRTPKVLVTAICALWLAGSATLVAAAGDTVAMKLRAWDTDHDGTLSLAEARKAASAKFDRLDHDKDGTLDRKEAAGARISKRSFDQSDPDKDGTLDKSEYLALLEVRFKAADADHDGTVSLKELKTAAGLRLMAMM